MNKYEYAVIDSKLNEETDRFSFAVVIKDNPRYEGKILAFNDFVIDEDDKGDSFINTQMLIVDSQSQIIEMEPEDQVYMEGLIQYMINDLLVKEIDRHQASNT